MKAGRNRVSRFSAASEAFAGHSSDLPEEKPDVLIEHGVNGFGSMNNGHQGDLNEEEISAKFNNPRGRSVSVRPSMDLSGRTAAKLHPSSPGIMKK